MSNLKREVNYSLSVKDIVRLSCAISSKEDDIPVVIDYKELGQDIDDVFRESNKVIMLFVLREDKSQTLGHWIGLLRSRERDKDERNEFHFHYEFFDPYGLKPDEEFKWLGREEAANLNQIRGHLVRLLYDKSKQGCTILYNEHPFQKQGKNVATCGRWVGFRMMMSSIQLPKFIKLFNKWNDQLITSLTNILLFE